MELKCLTISLLLVTLVFEARSQSTLPAFGQISAADVGMTVCDIEPTAKAYQLLRTGILRYENGELQDLRIRITHRIRIKILDAKAFDLATIRLRFLSKDRIEDIQHIRGVTYNLDGRGKVTKWLLNKNFIYRQRINRQLSEISFSLPQVKVGSVIEYEYDQIKENMWELPDWYFQGDLPTRISQYQMLVPQFISFTHQAFRSLPMEVKDSTVDEFMELGKNALESNRYRYVAFLKTFSMRNIPSFVGEPFMYGQLDYMERIKFQVAGYEQNHVRISTRNSWESMAEELRNDTDFYLQLNEDFSTLNPVVSGLQEAANREDSIAAIFKFVQRQFAFNGDFSIWSLQGVAPTWRSKKGSSGDLNWLLMALLQYFGIDAKPLLVSSRDHGMVYKAYPYIRQFNNVLAYVQDGKRRWILDAADDEQPCYLPPQNYLNSEGWLMTDAAVQEWIAIESTPHAGKSILAANMRFGRQQQLKTHINAYFLHFAKQLHSDGILPSRWSCSVDDTPGGLQLVPNGVDSMAEEWDGNFTCTLNERNNEYALPAILLEDFQTNPFSKASRKTDIDFGFERVYEQSISYFLEDGFQFKKIPTAFTFHNTDSSMIARRYVVKYGDQSISIRLKIEILRPYYAYPEYADIRNFYSQLFLKLKEPVLVHQP